jgi:DNA-binding transcriptional MerR regulator
VAEPTSETARRALLKSAEVCDLVKVQPYVLRSWEKEFPDLGTTRTAGGPRFYRQSDVDRVIRIKHLVFSEGLTLAGARRRLDEERAEEQPVDDVPFEDVPVHPAAAPELRLRLDGVKQGLRALLDLLSAPVGTRQASAPAPTGGNGEARAAATPVNGRLPIEDDVPSAPETKGSPRRTPPAKENKRRRAGARK